jgi:hypothetical protein
MTIKEDVADKSFTAKIREGEFVFVKPHLDIYDQPAVYFKYSVHGATILHRSVVEKWWWKWVPNKLEREVKAFCLEGTAKAIKLRAGKVTASKMGTVVKNVLRDE